MSQKSSLSSSLAVATTISFNGVEYAVLGCAAVASLYYFYTATTSCSEECPPVAPRGVFETAKLVGSPNMPEFVLDMQKELKTSVFQLNIPMPGGLYVVGDAKLQREIFTDKATDKPMAMMSAFVTIAGDLSMFTRSSFDPKWLHTRKGLAPAFSSSEVRRMNDVCNKHAQAWIDEFLFPLCMSNDPTFDPSEQCSKIAFRTVMEAAFEYEATDEDFFEFTTNLEQAAREFAGRQLTNPLRRLIGFLLPEVREAAECSMRVRAFAMKILSTYRDNPNKSDRSTVIKLVDNNMSCNSDSEKVAEILNFLIAGHETTGFTIASTIVLLAKHGNEQDKVRESLVKANQGTGRGTVKPSPYLQQVIMESIRHRPAAALGSLRQLGCAYTLTEPSPDDPKQTRTVRIPKGAAVMLSQVAANHDPAVFVDPDAFRPSRWDEATKDMIDSVMPFAAGPRNCLGQSLGKAELHTVLSKLLLEYEFELVNEGKMDFFATWKYAGAKVQVKKATKG